MENTRDFILFYINGERHQVYGDLAFLNLSEYLRYHCALVGTKVVCSEGDCGACTVLISRCSAGTTEFKNINSCIQPVFNLDGCVVVTVEGLQSDLSRLSPIQEAMVEHHGAQCGYCTPGICNSLTYLAERVSESHPGAERAVTSKMAQNFLSGNLCRCTGYEPIIKSACSIKLENYIPLKSRYLSESTRSELAQAVATDVHIQCKDIEGATQEIWLPASRKSLLGVLGSGRLVAGATDLGVQRNKNRLSDRDLISLQNLPELREIKDIKANDAAKLGLGAASVLYIGANATWDRIQDLVRMDFPEFSRAIDLFASPQIKHIATLAGNIINASPIADGVPFLLANDAKLLLLASDGSERIVELNDFYRGYKKMDLNAGEVLLAVILPKNQSAQRIFKVSQRKDLDIATVNLAIRYQLNGGVLIEFKIAVGGVAATSIRMSQLEAIAIGRKVDSTFLAESEKLVDQVLKPLSDVRGSADYRLLVVKNLIRKWALELQLSAGAHSPPRTHALNERHS